MSLPPQTIRIKRKATDEPVDYLHIQGLHSKKQRRDSEFIFHRQIAKSISRLRSGPAPEPRHAVQVQDNDSAGLLSGTANMQITQTSNPSSPGPFVNQNKEEVNTSSTPGTTPAAPHLDTTQELELLSLTVPRTFHISKSMNSASSIIGGGICKQQQRSPTVFIERKARPKRVLEFTSAPPPSTNLPQTTPDTAHLQLRSAPITTSTLKRPGRTSRIAPANKAPVETPDTLKLNASIEALAIQEVARLSNEPVPQHFPQPAAISLKSSGLDSIVRKHPPMRWKPKHPGTTWAERHPEEFIKLKAEADARIEQARLAEEQTDAIVDAEDELDENGYVIDTYIRVPVGPTEIFGDDDEPGKNNIGVLVIQENEEEDFFGNEEDEEEEEYDDDDENAENHYTADYPEEELSSDDEFGRDDYLYSMDREEYTGTAYSDDETNMDGDRRQQKYPWEFASRPRRRLGANNVWKDIDGGHGDEDDSDYDRDKKDEEELGGRQ